MNTVQKGDVLEAAIYDLIQAEIEDGKFLFRSECCQVFRRKGYHSRDRNSKIVFDVSVEVFLPRSKRHSLLVLIECKNLGRAVTVDEVEEFFTKSQQVGAANSKAIMVSSSGFQRGGYNFAKSKGMGLARYFEPSNLKWELRRSASASYHGNGGSEEIDFEEALTQEDYRSSLFDLYCQNGRKGTVSLWEFLDSIAQESTLSPAAYRSVRNPKGGASSSVSFIEKSELEVTAEAVLRSTNQAGRVDLERLCEEHPRTKGYKIVRVPVLVAEGEEHPPLGRVLFDERRIELFISEKSNEGRDRFTLAHELAHIILGHGELLRREWSDETDYDKRTQRPGADAAIPRMEWQANYLAACLLMPQSGILADFHAELRRLDIRDKGVGFLYVDWQICNIENFRSVTGRLMTLYGASRAAVAIRLDGLGVLNDVRGGNSMKTLAQSIIGNAPFGDLAQ